MSTMMPNTGAEPVLETQEAARDLVPLTLNNPELKARLDNLFADHFQIHRRPTFRVRVNHGLKRLLDIAVSLVCLLLLWPVIVIAGLATLCDTGRPVFYSQVRRIRFGRCARIYKMRTLIQGADRSLGKLVSIKHNGRFLNIAKADSCYTRVGRVLEKLWIVELPQIWSVLRGQMSLVGNRPIPDYVINALGPTPEVIERFASPQGLTGYVQIIGRDNVTDDERVELEYLYSRVFEKGDVFREDLRIIGLTLLSYLGLGRQRKATDFLEDHKMPAPPRGAGPAGMADEPAVLEHTGEANLLDVLACPTCYVVEDRCDPSQCKQQCVSSCLHGALAFEGNRPKHLAHCIACSTCVVACPRGAINKASLVRSEAGLRCEHCHTEYPQHNGVYDLLPRRAGLERSPYFDFYEKQYVQDNPQMHLEDTQWKLHELRPLLEPPGSYASVLDLGCGAGELGRQIALERKIPRRTASDWSSQILTYARQRDARASYLRTDAAFLPLRNGSYGLAMLIDVIEHQHKPEQVLRELQRVSRRLLVRTPLEDCWYERLRRRHKDVFRESSGHVVHFSLGSVRDRLAGHGWRIRNQSVKHISWVHWSRYVFGPYSLKVRVSSLARALMCFMLPKPIYRRVFVTNYNALCESSFLQSAEKAGASYAGKSNRQGRE